MTESYVGEIQIFGFNFPPLQWALAAGQQMPISQNAVLFSLLGTSYGGDGSKTFRLPNLAHRAGCSQGQGPTLSPRVIGELFGEDAVALTQGEMPNHNHTVIADFERGVANKVGTATTGAYLGTPSTPLSVLPNTATNVILNPNTLAPSGGNTPHENRQPLLALNYSIALYGDFPQFS